MRQSWKCPKCSNGQAAREDAARVSSSCPGRAGNFCNPATLAALIESG